MKGFGTALEKLIQGFEGFTDELRNLAEDNQEQGIKYDGPQLVADAGDGEEVNDGYEAAALGQQRNDITDETMVTVRSGDLRKVLDAYRKFNRYAREGKIMTQDERNVLHRHVKKVKHLVRRPAR
jgi:hypothetical protein